MYYFLNLFFIFSILGFCIEKGTMLLLNKKYNSSLLYGPWTIVYGIASIIIIYIGNLIKKRNYSKIKFFIIFVISNFIALTLLEFMAGITIEAVLGIQYWDYTNIPLHIGKYICVLVSLVWTVYACIVYYLIYPFILKHINKVSKKITIILSILFIVDIIFSACKFLKII